MEKSPDPTNRCPACGRTNWPGADNCQWCGESFPDAPPQDVDEGLLTAGQVAERLGVSRSTIYECLRDGTLPDTLGLAIFHDAIEAVARIWLKAWLRYAS